MSAATRRRLDELLDARKRQEMRKGDRTVVEEVRALLQSVDGQAEMGTLPGETMQDVMIRRMMHLDGYNLNALPGCTIEERMHSADLAANGKLVLTDEVRHAARHYIELYVGI